MQPEGWRLNNLLIICKKFSGDEGYFRRNGSEETGVNDFFPELPDVRKYFFNRSLSQCLITPGR